MNGTRPAPGVGLSTAHAPRDLPLKASLSGDPVPTSGAHDHPGRLKLLLLPCNPPNTPGQARFTGRGPRPRETETLPRVTQLQGAELGFRPEVTA